MAPSHRRGTPARAGETPALRPYPTVPPRGRGTIAGDLAVLVLLLVFAVLGNLVHDSIADLRSLGQGVQGAGVAVERNGAQAAAGVQRSLETAAGAVGGAPVVGGQLAGALR